MAKREAYLYIMSNIHHTVLYTGVTTDLLRRVYEHRTGTGSDFTRKYNITKLLYYDVFPTVYEAIASEKRVKKWRRQWKIELIQSMNPDLKDLWDIIYS